MRIYLRVISGEDGPSAWQSVECTDLPKAVRAVKAAIAEMQEDGEFDHSSEQFLLLAAPEHSIYYLFRAGP